MLDEAAAVLSMRGDHLRVAQSAREQVPEDVDLYPTVLGGEGDAESAGTDAHGRDGGRGAGQERCLGGRASTGEEVQSPESVGEEDQVSGGIHRGYRGQRPQDGVLREHP